MIDIKKLDEKEVVFINKLLSKKDEEDFSDFLRKRKETQLKAKDKKIKKLQQT